MKFFNKKLTTLTAAAALGAAGLFAAVPQGAHMGRHGQFGNRMATALGLSDAQKTEAKAIFQSAHQTAKPVMQQLRQQRQAVQAAIQAGKPDQDVQQLASAEGPELGQLAAIRASAFEKFYATLTPDQQQKLTALRQARHGNRAGTAGAVNR